MQIAILLFDRFTALDAVGPYEVLSRLPDADVDVRRAGARAEAHRHRAARAARRRLAGGAATPRHRARARWTGSGGADGGRARARVAARRARDLHVDHLGLHRLADPRRRGTARGQARDEPLDGARGAGQTGRASPSPSGSCSMASSSPPRASPPGSTWRSRLPARSRASSMRRRSSWGSSTTLSRPSMPARHTRRPRDPRGECARPLASNPSRVGRTARRRRRSNCVPRRRRIVCQA